MRDVGIQENIVEVALLDEISNKLVLLHCGWLWVTLLALDG